MKAVILDYNRTLFDPEKESLFPGALAILKSLKKKLKLALIAQGSNERLEEIKRLGLAKYFSEIFVSEEKSTDDFKKCLAKLDALPQETYVVGDRVMKELKIGKKLGCVTIWFRNGKFKDELPRRIEETPKYTVSNLREILKIIK